MDRNPLLKNVSKAIQDRLANREVGRIATHFKQYYHGKRAPYHIDPKVLFETLSPGFRKLMDVIGDEMKEQLTS